GARIPLSQGAQSAAPAGRTEEVDLVEDHHPRLGGSPQVGQDLLDGRRLLLHRMGAKVEDLDDDVGFGHLLQRGSEGGHQVGGQLLDEAHGVGQQQAPARRELQLAGSRIQGGEQLLLGANARAGQRIQQRRLARVRVPDDGGGLQLSAPAARALLMPLRAHLLDLAVEVADAPADAAPLDLDLLLAETTARANPSPPAADLAVVGVCPDQARQQVVQAGSLDLEAAFVRACMLGEDLEDDLRAVEHPSLDLELQVALLARTEVLVADDQVELALALQVAQRLDL